MSFLNDFLKKQGLDSESIFKLEDDISGSDISSDEILLEKGYTKEDILENKKAYFSNFEFIDLQTKDIERKVMAVLPKDIAVRYKMVPINFDGEYFKVGMLNPDDITAKTTLQFISTKIGKPYKIFLISLGDYNEIIKKYSNVKNDVVTALDEYIDVQKEETEKSKEEGGEEVDIIKNDSPIAKIVSGIINGAAEKKASDIHIEINDTEISVRYRVDGVMEQNIVLPKGVHRSVVARVKILSNMKIDERRKPQDGRFSGNFFNRRIDFRVSTFPTYYGEKIVMRLLEQDRGALPIDEVGFSKENLEKIRRGIKNSYGMILVCGPTGSGKTNTLYSLINELDKKKSNIVSLENPIELNVDGVSQSQIRADIGYTFANGLKTILRQDPDIIMIGEIRDKETAALAVEASLTGHLVLSTIHTNTAADVPQRLVDMGVEPYLIGPTLIACVGQRLIRTINPEFKVEEAMNDVVREYINKEIETLDDKFKHNFLDKTNIYKAVRKEDNDKIYKGRTAVFEVLEMDVEMRRLIISDPSSISIFELARKNGFLTFKEDAILKALDGVTSFEEVIKL